MCVCLLIYDYIEIESYRLNAPHDKKTLLEV